MKRYTVAVTRTTTHTVEGRTKDEAMATRLGEHNQIGSRMVGYTIWDEDDEWDEADRAYDRVNGK